MLPLVLLGFGFGLFAIAVAVFNWDHFFFDPESRLIEVFGGENMVRWYWGLCGLALIVLTCLYWAEVL
jgi:hypothetical protein